MAATGYDAAAALARQAARLEGPRNGLPALLALTDPERSPDPVALAYRLPTGAGLILRTYGRPEIEALAFALADLAQARGLTLLISADPALARRCGAQGVHWPERWLTAAHVQASSDLLITTSAHSPTALRRARPWADAVLISPVFPSASPSATHPIGHWRASALAQRATMPVYALGGITKRSVRRLKGLGFAGVAAIGGL